MTTEHLSTPFYYIGAATTCYWAVLLARHLYCYLRPSSLSRYAPPGKDSWALVTGASDGIGFGFSQELCKRGFNVFLHGRDREKLLRRQEQLQREYPVAKTKVIVFNVMDLTEDVDDIPREIGDARLTVLVNNVGGETSPFQRLTEQTYRDVRDKINLNATFMAQISRVLLPVLEKNSPSLIINLSSAGSYGFPWLSVYAGAKGFVDSFSKSLDAEMKAEGKGVEVLGLRIGNVRSKSNDVEVSLFTPTPEVMASAALDRVGCGRSIVAGYWWHAVQTMGLDWLPRAVMVWIATRRLRGLKQEYEEKKKP